MERIAINILGYQVAWWACVLSVRAEVTWVGLVVTAGVFALHLCVSPACRSEVWSVPAAALLGYAVDNLATMVGALQFNYEGPVNLPAPPWIAALWLAFSTTLYTCFSWLRSRPVTAVIIGAASGPIAYAAGAMLGIVALPRPLWSVVVLAVLWGTAIPIVVFIVTWAAGRPDSSATLVRQFSGRTA